MNKTKNALIYLIIAILCSITISCCIYISKSIYDLIKFNQCYTNGFCLPGCNKYLNY